MKSTARMALCGVFSASALATLLLTVFPFATYALPALAGVFFIPLVIECGKRWAFGAYAAVTLLAFIMVPDVEAKMLFAAFFGYYPILKALLERLSNRAVEWGAKLLVFNTAAVGTYALLSRIGLVALNEFRLDGLSSSLAICLALFLLAGNLVFVLYDIGMTRFLPLYFMRLQPILRRIFRV